MQQTSGKLTVVATTKGKLPRLPFDSWRKKILGNHYELTIAFVTPKKIKELNKTYRQKEYVPNVLSFPLTKSSGEIYACLSQIRRDAPNYDQTFEQFVPYLLIHSMLHLKGYVHSSKMDREELRLMRILKIASIKTLS